MNQNPPQEAPLRFEGLWLALSLIFPCALASASPATTNAPPIPLGQLGAAAERQYSGDGLSVVTTQDGARLRCVFQKMDGEVTREGLWLLSTAEESKGERFRVTALSVGRRAGVAQPSRLRVGRASPPGVSPGGGTPPGLAGEDACATTLPRAGTVAVAGNVARFLRPELVEEYSVSADGVRQDFVVLEKPAGNAHPPGPPKTLPVPSPSPLNGDRAGVRCEAVREAHVPGLRVELAVDGAEVAPAADGVTLVLHGSGRRIAYNRLRVTDATGRELTARMEIPEPNNPGRATLPRSLDREGVSARQEPRPTGQRLAVLVDDTEAVYPVRLDPTFSDANWISMGGLPGTDGPVYAAVMDDSGNLYIGGRFTIVGDVFATNIAKWNGSSWSALGQGINDQVSALAVSGSDLYAGGAFTNVGGVTANRIAKWDGGAWSALDSGMNSNVLALAASGSDVFAGGLFTTAGGIAANQIAKWDGSSWNALGSGMDRTVSALAVSGSDLYAGGWFTTAGGSTANRIARWNGTTWSALGVGMIGTVRALAVSGADVYAGGEFRAAGGVPASKIARWNGSSWNMLGAGISAPQDAPYSGGIVLALAVSSSNLFAGGGFTTAGRGTANSIANWNGNSWSALGSGMNDWVRALAVSGSDLYAGGWFTTAGGIAVSKITKWNGSSWSALGAGIAAPLDAPYYGGIVYALAVSDSNLYAGGNFLQAGESAANRIAKWNGTSWSALGSGMNGEVRALVTAGSSVYAGGFFTMSGGVPANYVAKWNGSSWTNLGSGMNSHVYALAVSGNDLYAGGWFTTAGGSAANYIAMWNGSSWGGLGSGMGGGLVSPFVYALAVSGSDLYAGGLFTSAGGIAASKIAKWNGSSWNALGAGITAPQDAPFYGGIVFALGVSSGDLYVGGLFTNASGIPAIDPRTSG
jgi:hypothetical protein